MSVLIKGMKMPKGCIACPFMFFGRDDCLVWCKWLDEPSGEWSNCGGKWRHPDCPLVEVPTPHGRLIDADELERFMYHHAFELDSADQQWDSGCWVRYRLFENAMKAMPTIIEAEEGEKDDEHTD